MQGKERFSVIAENLLIEFVVFFFGAFRGGLLPKRLGVVDGGKLFFLLCVFIDKVNFDGHKGAVFIKQLFELIGREEFLAFFIDVQNDFSSLFLFVGGGDFIVAVFGASPEYGRGARV